MMVDELPVSADAQVIVDRLGLQPHPEGGWYKETWRGPIEGTDGRGLGTAILFLLDAGQRSRWHRVDATEIWLFNAGVSVHLSTVSMDGSNRIIQHRLGPNVGNGDIVQHVISPDQWQSAKAIDGWCLVSCIVVPAFEFSGFELAKDGWEPADPIV